MESGGGPITRWRLVDGLEQAAGGSLILVVAAAGYGKSTLLQQWAANSSRAAAIVRATPDHDAERLCVEIAGALVPVLPAAAPLLERAGRSDPDWALELVPALLALASQHQIALAIDDTHQLASPSARELLAVLAADWPSPSVLVLSGRERPLVPLVRSRPNAPIHTVGERDLDFDEAELDQARRSLGIDADTSELLDLTGGWPAGIRLAAVVRNEQLPGGAPISVEGYLSEHVLASFTPHELDYLGHLAALAPVPASLVDRILHRDDTLETLRSLARRGLPMVEVPDREDETIVVHALLAEVLTRRLDRRTDGATRSLLDLAVDECLQNGDLSFAFNLLDRAGRRDRQRAMAYMYMFRLIVSGRTRELRSWLERFGLDEITHDPQLVFAYANVLRPRDEGRVRELLAPFADDVDTVLPDGIHPALACRRLLTAFGLDPADPDDVDLRGGWRQTHGVTRAWDLYSDDRLEEAERILLDLRDSAAKYPLTHAVGLAKLAIIAVETGRPAEAAALAESAGQLMAEGRMEETSLGFIVDAVNLKLARRRGDLEGAAALATAARRKMAAVGDGTMLERVTTLIEVGNLYADLGHPPSMGSDLADEADRILARWPSTVRLDRQLAQLRRRLADAADQPAARGTAGPESITTAELRVLRYLPSHLTLARIADDLYVSHSTVKTQCQSIYRKLQVGNRADAVAAAMRLGLLA